MIDYSNAFVFSTSLLVVVFRYGINIYFQNQSYYDWFILYLIIKNFYLEAVNFNSHIGFNHKL